MKRRLEMELEIATELSPLELTSPPYNLADRSIISAHLRASLFKTLFGVFQMTKRGLEDIVN